MKISNFFSFYLYWNRICYIWHNSHMRICECTQRCCLRRRFVVSIESNYILYDQYAQAFHTFELIITVLPTVSSSFQIFLCRVFHLYIWKIVCAYIKWERVQIIIIIIISTERHQFCVNRNRTSIRPQVFNTIFPFEFSQFS